MRDTDVWAEIYLATHDEEQADKFAKMVQSKEWELYYDYSHEPPNKGWVLVGGAIDGLLYLRKIR